MAQEMPVGRPLYYYRQPNDKFKLEIVGDRKGWSLECLDWLNYCQFLEIMRIGRTNDYAEIISAVHGEVTVNVEGNNLIVDGYCDHPEKGLILFEFLGCR